MKKLLIAEDDVFLANAYKAKLTKTGFEVGIATDGEELLAMINTFTPDAILLDLMMPKMDGFSVLEKLRKMDQYKSIPIIVATNLGQKEDIDRAMAMGASGYIVKSNLSLSDLVEKINTFLPSSTEKNQ
jgi:two-component system, OmpR family, alkaline phosphatase synthesis response regulator PhoP